MTTTTTRYRRNPRLMLEWGDAADKLFVVEPRMLRRFRITPALLQLINRMTEPRCADELAAEQAPEDVDALLERLTGVGILEQDDGSGAEDESDWTAAELAVHAQAARGEIHGHHDRSAIPPAHLVHTEATSRVSLPEPDTSRSQPLSELLRTRRSIREFAPEPIPIDRLGAFLGRSARVRGRLGTDNLEATRRPSASGGGRHSLELYVVARDVTGLRPGAYHYDPFAHALDELAPWTSGLDEQQRRLVCGPTLTDQPPPVSLYLASYFRRVQWKYGGMTLSVIYRDTGCLVQTMYLVATDLGLAPCATAAIDAEINPTFLGPYRDQLIHVGNFALGRPAAVEKAPTTFHPLDTEGDRS